MFIEHLVYSAAIAVLVGMVVVKYTGVDHSWIIIFASVVPDIDYLFKIGCEFFSPLPAPTFMHGDFHALPGMVFLSFFIAMFFSNGGIKFISAFAYSLAGYGLHLVEDFIVHPPYFNRYLYPFDTTLYGANILSDVPDLVVANSRTLLIGIILLGTVVLARSYIETGWSIRNYVGGGMDVCRKSVKTLWEGKQ